MQGTVAGRDLLEPRSLADAVKMLRDEGPLVPMAGCTDLYVALNFGTLRPTRFLNLWNLDALRGIEARGTDAAHRRADDLHRHHHIGCDSPAAADAGRRSARGRRRADSESRHPRRQRRECVAGGRHPAGPARGRRRRRAAQRGGHAARADDVVLYRLSSDRRAPRRIDRRASRFRPFAGVNGSARSARAPRRRSRRSSSPVCGIAQPRLAMGSVAPTPLRLSQTEQALGSGASLAEAQEILQREIAPIDDLRSTAEYRRQVAANLLGQFQAEVRGQSRR